VGEIFDSGEVGHCLLKSLQHQKDTDDLIDIIFQEEIVRIAGSADSGSLRRY